MDVLYYSINSFKLPWIIYYCFNSLKLGYLAGAKLELNHLLVGGVAEDGRQLAQRLPRRLPQAQQVVVDALAQDVGFHDGGLLASRLFKQFQLLLFLVT